MFVEQYPDGGPNHKDWMDPSRSGRKGVPERCVGNAMFKPRSRRIDRWVSQSDVLITGLYIPVLLSVVHLPILLKRAWSRPQG